MDPELESVVYRLVQEALNNVVKHSAADIASVQVRNRENRLEVLVVDDGCGFDPAAEHSGFGLTGMRERVELAAGELRIESTPGSGTRVMASVQLSGEPGSGLDQAPRERTPN